MIFMLLNYPLRSTELYMHVQNVHLCWREVPRVQVLKMFATSKAEYSWLKSFSLAQNPMQIERKAFLCFYPICVYFIHLFVNFLLARYIVHTNGEFLFYEFIAVFCFYRLHQLTRANLLSLK